MGYKFFDKRYLVMPDDEAERFIEEVQFGSGIQWKAPQES